MSFEYPKEIAAMKAPNEQDLEKFYVPTSPTLDRKQVPSSCPLSISISVIMILLRIYWRQMSCGSRGARLQFSSSLCSLS